MIRHLIIKTNTMKKPAKPARTSRSPRRHRIPVSPKTNSSGQLANESTDQPDRGFAAPGILSADIVKGKGGVEAVVVRVAPHNLIVISGGAKPTVSMASTHHGFVAEAFELNGQLEQVINHVRMRFPKLRVD
jgi:hypothetical protein